MTQPGGGDEAEAARADLAAYRRVQRRTAELVGGPGVEGATPVPACPGWDLQALVAHLAGLAVDVASGNTERYGSRRWTAEQVTARAGWPLPRLLEEWSAATDRLGQASLPPHLALFGSLGNLVLTDLAIHHHDARGALNAPDPAEETVHRSLDGAVALLGQRLHQPQAAGTLPALQLRTVEGDTWTLGDVDGPAPVVVRGGAFELWRGLSGRRSRHQVRSLAWSADPEPFLDRWILPATPFPEADLAY